MENVLKKFVFGIIFETNQNLVSVGQLMEQINNLWDNLRDNLRGNLRNNLRNNLQENLWDNLREN